MNISDVDAVQVWKDAVEEHQTENPAEILFDHQSKLISKYVPIESRNLLFPVPLPSDFSIDYAPHQFWLKHLAWCVVEEIGEAKDAAKERGLDHQHVVEEFIDALHFLVELMIYARVEPTMFTPTSTTVDCEESNHLTITFRREHGKSFRSITVTERTDMWRISTIIVQELSMAMWQLRNKPWKNTQIPTDMPRFYDHIELAFAYLFCYIWTRVGCDEQAAVVTYLKKNLVNQFRIRSNY